MLFMSIYGVAMDALLQCFIVDETNQKGKGKAKWAPADLADLMDTENEWFWITSLILAYLLE